VNFRNWLLTGDVVTSTNPPIPRNVSNAVCKDLDTFPEKAAEMRNQTKYSSCFVEHTDAKLVKRPDIVSKSCWGAKNIGVPFQTATKKQADLIEGNLFKRSGCAFFPLTFAVLNEGLCNALAPNLITMYTWLMVISVLDMLFIILVIQLNR